jgi:hypothetical protein
MTGSSSFGLGERADETIAVRGRGINIAFAPTFRDWMI